MKLIASLIITFLTLSLNAQTVNFMPENDLHLYDNAKADSNITKQQFNNIIDIALESYQKEADENNERIKVNRKWDDSTVNANVRRFWGKVTINMYGGLARRPEVIADGFALVLCHEIGHAYGGFPYLRTSSHISAEGQADYYGALACLKRVFEVLPESKQNETLITDHMINLCTDQIQNLPASEREEEFKFCTRGLVAGQSLGNLLAVLMKVDEPLYETPDLTEVSKTQLSYPATLQCRLDTYKAGTLNMDRPLCWFKPEN